MKTTLAILFIMFSTASALISANAAGVAENGLRLYVFDCGTILNLDPARFRLDRTDEAHHDVIEHAGLRLGKARRAADEKIGDAREHFDAACTGAAGERGLELIDDRKGLHALACRHIVETPTTMPRER